MTKLFILLFSLTLVQSHSQNYKSESPAETKKRQDTIIQTHVYDCADKINYTVMMKEYPKAEKLLANYVTDMKAKNGEDWVHPTALFYYGVSLYEQRKWKEADIAFNRSLSLYPNFSDAKFYKVIFQGRAGSTEEYQRLCNESEADYKIGLV